MPTIKRIDIGLTNALGWIMVLLLSGMSVIIFANVTMRYITGGSIVWAEEVARYAMVWLTFLGTGPVLRIGGHIAIENLQDTLPQAAAKWIRGGIALSMAGMGIGMVWMGIEYMNRAKFQMTASTQISFSYIYAAIPIGGVLLLWSTLAIATDYVQTRTFDSDVTSAGHQEGVQV